MKRRKDFTHYPRWEDRVALRFATGVVCGALILAGLLLYRAGIAWGWWL